MMYSHDDSISVSEGDLGDQQHHAEWLNLQMKRIAGNSAPEGPLLGLPETVADPRSEDDEASRSGGNNYSKAFLEYRQAVTHLCVESDNSPRMTGDTPPTMPLLGHREAVANLGFGRDGDSQPRRLNTDVDECKNFLVGIAMIEVTKPLVASGIWARNQRKWKQQNQVSSPQKTTPILPY